MSIDFSPPALHNAWSPIMASLFAGNAIVLKCSENVFWSSQWFVGAIRKCLQACGHDPELVQVCRFLIYFYPINTAQWILNPSWFAASPSKRTRSQGLPTLNTSHSLGQKLSGARLVPCTVVAYIFSYALQIAIAATEHLTPVTLELGGKDPAIILEGTDLEKWASLWMRGIL